MTQLVVKNEGGPGRFCIMPSSVWPTTNFKVIVLLSSWRLSCRVSAGLKFTSDILSKQLQFCSDIWKFLGHFFNTNFYHHKRKLPSALLNLKPGVVLLPFRMVSAV